MNNLVLIGNGFDLAHELKTKYSDFILSYLNNSFQSISASNGYYEDGLITIQSPRVHRLNIFNSIASIFDIVKANDIKFEFKHSFLKKIVDSSIESNWVDIESKYYSELIGLFRRLENIKMDSHKSIDSELVKLNNCFELIKEELIKYLLVVDSKNKIKSKEIDNLLIENLQLDKLIQPTLFLNFNYTSTIDMYVDLKGSLGLSIVNIHGKLNDTNNPIIFGYGDEMDTYYEKIERLNTNEFLRNIKSFWYFKTNNYKTLTNFIDAEDYTVYILGHSCGLSDRILLNSVFEHPNCRLIKIFYYQKSETENDYFEKTQEISRHFKSTNKEKMRNKIMSFPECKPLTKFQK